MQRTSLPVNISLLQLTPEKLQTLKPVRVLDLFDGGTSNFHEDGLFSISIFGRVGSEERDKRFSYIDIRTEVFHPYFFKQLCRLRELYREIMAGKAYAVWNDIERDFEASDSASGQTGYHFFLQHWKDIVFKGSTGGMFTYKGTPAKWVGGATTKEIEALEKRLNQRFPDDYRNFLKKYGAGSIGPTEIYGIHSKTDSKITLTFLLDDLTQLDMYIPEGMIPFSAIGNGTYASLYQGKVVAWKPQRTPRVDVQELASSFTEWLVPKLEKLKPGSDIRDLRIGLINKFKDKALTDKILVLPAGLRDITVDENNRRKEGEINDMYRTIISISNAINTTSMGSSSVLDTSRFSLQMAFCKVYDYINSLLEGKGGFFQKKWGARRVFNGTRNVISSMDTSQPILGIENAPKQNSTVFGLFQTLKGALPLAQHHILAGWISKVFSPNDGNAWLVNPKTLQREMVQLSSTTIDRWTTASGIEKVIDSYFDVSLRHKPVMVEDYYIGLVYRGPDFTFRFFNDIEELPYGDPKFGKEFVHPITLCELLYLSGYRIWNTLPALVTRYPVTGAGSIYPSYVYVKNTVKSEVRRELDENWQPLDKEYTALEYPVFDEPYYVDTMIPHPSRLLLLGAD